MNWYIGQPIVAIKNHSYGMFKIGQEFEIKQLKLNPCRCGDRHVLIHVGINYQNRFGVYRDECANCKSKGPATTDPTTFFHERCFAPLDIDLSEIHEALKQTEPV